MADSWHGDKAVKPRPLNAVIEPFFSVVCITLIMGRVSIALQSAVSMFSRMYIWNIVGWGFRQIQEGLAGSLMGGNGRKAYPE